MAIEQRKALIKQIEAKRGSRLLCCLTSDRENAQGLIAKDFIFRFFQHIRAMQAADRPEKLEKLDVFLFTLGGDTLAAYALARLVRQLAKTIGVLVPHMCLSGGTLFALGADEIVMTRLGTLSAIDPSINGPLNPVAKVVMGMPGIPGQEIKVPVGVESVAGFEKLVDEWKLDANGTAGAFALLANKVDPLLLGDLQRSKEQIVKLATALMKIHVKPEDENAIKLVVETLASGLGSHDYLISADEAHNEVKLHVAEEDSVLEGLILKLYEDFAEEMELGIPFNPALDMQMPPQAGRQPQPITKLLKLVMIESSDKADVWEREIVVVAPNQAQIRKNYWRK